MVVYNVTCNVALEVEKKWLEWIDKQLNDLSKSENINTTSILKLNSKVVNKVRWTLKKKYHLKKLKVGHARHKIN